MLHMIVISIFSHMKLVAYTLKEHVPPFIYGLFITTFLFVIDWLVNLLDAILAKHLDILVILELFVLNLAWMLALSIPMSFLVSSLMAFGRLSGDNEILALRVCGISPVKILLPLVIVASLSCIGLIYFNNFILPESNHRAAALKTSISRKKAPAFITPGRLIKDFPNYRIWIDQIDYRNDILHGVKIYYWEKRQPPRFMFAKTAKMEYVDEGYMILIHMKNGENHIVDNKDPNRYLRLKFKKQTIAIENVDASLKRSERHYRSDREMSVKDMLKVVQNARNEQKKNRDVYPGKIFGDAIKIGELLISDTASNIPPRQAEVKWWKAFPVSSPFYRRLNSQEREKLYLVNRYQKKMQEEEKQASKYLVEIHKKYSIPFACIIFVLIGGPIGIMARKGGLGVGVLYSLGFFLLYWVCLQGGEALADKLIISPWLSMWSPNIIVGSCSLIFLYRLFTIGK